MTSHSFPRVLLLAPVVDADDVGEAFVAYKWAFELSQRCRLTVCCYQRSTQRPVAHTLPDAEVVTWPMPQMFERMGRFNAMFKPYFPHYSSKVLAYANKRMYGGHSWDIAHQLMPLAARYTTPLRHLGIPYVMGPVGGTIPTPEAFKAETSAAPIYTKLRAIDHLRFRFDPFLRDSYAKASTVLGVAPYMRDYLSSIPLESFVPILELGVDEVPLPVIRQGAVGQLRMLHVGRAVRTKALRDVIRAMALLKDIPGITLTSAGDGEELELCRKEAEKLGVVDRVTFLGRVPRQEVEELYKTHDAFVFPSFREPTGNVLFEAMRWGLPIITAKAGGPGWIVDDSFGETVLVSNPETFAHDISHAIRRLANDPQGRLQKGMSARQKLVSEGLWSTKAELVMGIYADVLEWEYGQSFSGEVA